MWLEVANLTTSNHFSTANLDSSCSPALRDLILISSPASSANFQIFSVSEFSWPECFQFHAKCIKCKNFGNLSLRFRRDLLDAIFPDLSNVHFVGSVFYIFSAVCESSIVCCQRVHSGAGVNVRSGIRGMDGFRIPKWQWTQDSDNSGSVS